MDLVVFTLVFSALVAPMAAARSRVAERIRDGITDPDRPDADPPTGPPSASLLERLGTGRAGLAVAGGGALVGGMIGLRLAGAVGLVAGGCAGFASTRMLRQRDRRRRIELLERQLAEVVESVALGVRSGLSIVQAFGFAGQETAEPMAAILARMAADQRLGCSFEEALTAFGARVGTEDARLFVLVIGIHSRAGGNLGGALDEVAATIRHRLGVRRELRALSAQGRISAVVLGSVPIGFFLFLSITSGDELGPVYRSPAGAAMIAAGLILEALAYLWMRRLLRVEA